MGYPNQQFGYAKLAQVPKSYILSYSTATKQHRIDQLNIGDHNYFWEEKILKFGKVCN